MVAQHASASAAAGGDGAGGGASRRSRRRCAREQPKVGRNEPCPCGSGKKYKKCHGATAVA